MPELIKGGPDLPVELLRLHDEGKVVFFCGAGVSMGTGLPSFAKLVDDVYEAIGETLTAYEESLLKAGQYDKVLGILEDRMIDGSMREAVATILSKPWGGPLDVHKDLLTLSKVKDGGFHLVTTNFDARFAETGDIDEKYIMDAPRLPLPKHGVWRTLVHLHGRLHPTCTLDQMVLTSADFGRAYLTERWASRFITELFRTYTVVFVGYSLADPVMGYMVDALAAERSRGQTFQKAYAFAQYKGGPKARDAEVEAWRAKKVEPLLFEVKTRRKTGNPFELLSRTLSEWAKIQRDPLGYRTRIALSGIKKLTSGLADPEAQKVCWALSNPAVAIELSNLLPVTEEKDFPAIAAWMEVFDQYGLLSILSRTEVPGAGPKPSAQIPADHLVSVRRYIASWVAKHCHVPQVFGWVISHGHRLDDNFRNIVRYRLTLKPDAKLGIPLTDKRLRLLWTVMIYDHQRPIDEAMTWDQLHAAALSEVERRIIEQSFLVALKPRLVVRPGESLRRRFRDDVEGELSSGTDSFQVAHLALVLSDEEYRLRPRRFNDWGELLARYASTISNYLQAALELLPADEEGYSNPIYYRPFLEESGPKRIRDGWSNLIDLARDSYFALKEHSPGSEVDLLKRWAESKITTFERLALYVLSKDPMSDIGLAQAIFLGDQEHRLWSSDLRREILAVLLKASPRMPEPLLNEIYEAIKRGPPADDLEGIPADRKDAHARLQIGIRLRELMRAERNVLTGTDMLLVLSISGGGQDEPDDMAPGYIEPVSSRYSDFSSRDIRDADIDKEAFRDRFELFVRDAPVRAFVFLLRLSDYGKSSKPLWDRLFWHAGTLVRDGKLLRRFERCFIPRLLDVPEGYLGGAGHAAADFIAELSKHPLQVPDNFFDFWMCIWAQKVPEPSGTEDILTQALNSASGRLAEAATERLWALKPMPGSGFPDEVGSYLAKIVSDPHAVLARAYLATRLSSLFAVDPDWTSQHFLPWFNANSPEALQMWSAYSWAASAGPNLFSAIKNNFLAVLVRYVELGEQRSNLVSLFISASIDAIDAMTPTEIRTAVQKLPEEGLVDILGHFEQIMRGTTEVNSKTWREKIEPWLIAYWPKAASRNTASTSDAIVTMISRTGDAFPEAAAWAKKFLRPGSPRGLENLVDDEVQPEWAGALLDVVFRAANRQPHNEIYWTKRTVETALKYVRLHRPELMQDPRYLELRTFHSS
ncbi:MAG: SIR2 family protein [Ferrovibrio sp.]|uniref:SIR2 family protein n=1 Tax=Ferrovibrio sp. TaxID=1917215 RepID=UPI00260FAA7B|nr:SIR2 family protein [Ferrovibrio sp.]MCW0234257.1 SIR2 family protein [Ferrovibrio sp.]